MKTEMNTKIDKNTVILEDLSEKLVTIAEVQKNSMNINENSIDNLSKAFDIRADIIELATKNISGDVNEIKEEVIGIREDLNTVEFVTSKNWNEIIKLKAVK